MRISVKEFRPPKGRKGSYIYPIQQTFNFDMLDQSFTIGISKILFYFYLFMYCVVVVVVGYFVISRVVTASYVY